MLKGLAGISLSLPCSFFLFIMIVDGVTVIAHHAKWDTSENEIKKGSINNHARRWCLPASSGGSWTPMAASGAEQCFSASSRQNVFFGAFSQA